MPSQSAKAKLFAWVRDLTDIQIYCQFCGSPWISFSSRGWGSPHPTPSSATLSRSQTLPVGVFSQAYFVGLTHKTKEKSDAIREYIVFTFLSNEAVESEDLLIACLGIVPYNALLPYSGRPQIGARGRQLTIYEQPERREKSSCCVNTCYTG